MNGYFFGNSRISLGTFYYIMDYYKRLYNSYEMKTIPEIANDLDISISSLREYISFIYSGKNSEGKYSKNSLMILLCTKVSSCNQIYND